MKQVIFNKNQVILIRNYNPIILGKWMIKIRHFKHKSKSIYRKKEEGYAFSLNRHGKQAGWTDSEEKGYQIYCNYPPTEGLPSYTNALINAIKQLNRIRIYHPRLY